MHDRLEGPRPFSISVEVSVRKATALLALVLIFAACGSSPDSPLEVKSELLFHETAQSIWVWAPDAEGSWPVVFAVPGSSGKAQDLEVLATELAQRGVVVFGTDWRTTRGAPELQQDVECGYRFIRTVADQYGGDLTQPVTIAGFSMGATAAVNHGLGADYGPDGWYDVCFEGAPRPDVVVSLAGCHYNGVPPSQGFTEWGNFDANIVLVSGSDDTECRTEQSEFAEDVLETEGYQVKRFEVAGGNHGEFIFLDSDNNWQPVPVDHPTSQETVTIILDAIQEAR